MANGVGTSRPRRPAHPPAAKVALGLLAVAGLLLALSLATRYGAYRVELARPGSAQVDAAKAVMRLFDVNIESNVPTWYSSALLLGCAVLAGLLAALARRAGSRDAGAWTGLAAVLALLSLDEIAVLHERLGGPAGGVLGDAARGPLRFAWVVPGVLLVLVAGIVLLGFVRRLPSPTRRLVVTAAAEGLEMAGSVVLLYALLGLLRLRPQPAGGYAVSLYSGTCRPPRPAN